MSGIFRSQEKIFISHFDDGPHPDSNSICFRSVKKYNAKQLFFVLEKMLLNILIFIERILDEGHRAGNHTFNHLNGWKVTDELYLRISCRQENISTPIYFVLHMERSRVPGKIITGYTKFTGTVNFKIIMWDVLSGDFDPSVIC